MHRTRRPDYMRGRRGRDQCTLRAFWERASRLVRGLRFPRAYTLKHLLTAFLAGGISLTGGTFAVWYYFSDNETTNPTDQSNRPIQPTNPTDQSNHQRHVDRVRVLRERFETQKCKVLLWPRIQLICRRVLCWGVRQLRGQCTFQFDREGVAVVDQVQGPRECREGLLLVEHHIKRTGHRTIQILHLHERISTRTIYCSHIPQRGGAHRLDASIYPTDWR